MRLVGDEGEWQIILFCLFGIGVGIGLPLVICSFYARHQLHILLFLALLSVGSFGLIWNILQKAITSSRQKLDFFSPVVAFPISYSILYGIGPLINTHIPSSQFSFYFVGLTVYFLGVLSVKSFWGRPSQEKKIECEWNSSRFWYFLAFLILVFSFGVFIALGGSKLPVFRGAQVQTLRTGFVHEIGGIIYFFFRTGEVILILFFIFMFSRKKRVISNPLKMLFILFILFLLVGLAARRIIIVPLLTGLVAFHYARKRINAAKLIVLVLIFFLFLAGAGRIRSKGSFRLQKEELVETLRSEARLYAGLLYVTQEHFPATEKFMGWNGFVQPFKAVLPGTQKSIGDILKEDVIRMRFRGGGFMPSILGGFYMNFGWIGIIIGMYLCGVISYVLYMKMLHRKNEFSVIVYSYWFVYLISAIQGMILAEIWPLYVVFLLFLTHVYSKKKSVQQVKT